MPNENLSILRKFIMEYGSILGLCWVAVFASYVYGFRTQSGLLMFLGMLMLLLLLPIEFFLGMRMKKRSVQLEIPMSFLFTYMNVLGIFMYACLLSGCMEYVYFAFIDKGELFNALNTMLTSADVEALYKQTGLNSYYKQIIGMLDELSYIPAFDKTLLLFNNSFITSLILSLPVAIVAYFYKPAILK